MKHVIIFKVPSGIYYAYKSEDCLLYHKDVMEYIESCKKVLESHGFIVMVLPDNIDVQEIIKES